MERKSADAGAVSAAGHGLYETLLDTGTLRITLAWEFYRRVRSALFQWTDGSTGLGRISPVPKNCRSARYWSVAERFASRRRLIKKHRRMRQVDLIRLLLNLPAALRTAVVLLRLARDQQAVLAVFAALIEDVVAACAQGARVLLAVAPAAAGRALDHGSGAAIGRK